MEIICGCTVSQNKRFLESVQQMKLVLLWAYFEHMKILAVWGRSEWSVWQGKDQPRKAIRKKSRTERTPHCGKKTQNPMRSFGIK